MLHGVFMSKNIKIRHRVLVVFSGIVIFSILMLLGVGILYATVYRNIDFSSDESLFISERRGNITKFYYDAFPGDFEYTPRELCSTQPYENKKIWYPYENIGENLKKAFVCAEDRRFFTHHGVDVKRTSLAMLNYFLRLRPKFGGSTITQQLIKNISGDNEQTVTRKLSEMIRATHIENVHSKEEIFELYLNIIPMGEGISGVGLASEYYFGKTPSELTNAEAATLVGITNAPTKYNPRQNPEACTKKRNNVLYAMYECGFLSETEYKSARISELSVVDNRQEGNSANSWFIETVCDDVCRDIARARGISEGAARILFMNGGFSVYTTENPEVQKVIEEYFEKSDNFPEAVKSGLCYSMAVFDSKTGDLVGIVGGAGKKTANRILNNALVPHTPASTLKPLALYAPLINEGVIRWSTVFDDVPVTFTKDKSGEYIKYPQNYPAIYDGLTTVSDALRVSKNTVAVKLYNILGKKRVFDGLRENFGFTTLVESKTLENGRVITDLAPSPLALGQLSVGISLRDLTHAYTVFPNGGVLSQGRSYVAVYDHNGELLIDNPAQKKEIFSEECAGIMNQLLMRVTESGTAKAITLDGIIDTAGKTGTSAQDKDRLFVGYTPYYTAGIWCGYPNKNGEVGTQRITHLEIWDKIMKKIHEETLGSLEQPESFSTERLQFLPYCKDSGEIFTETCEYDPRGDRMDFGYFSAKDTPDKCCTRHILCYYDKETCALASSKCPHENLVLTALLDVADRKFPVEIFITDAEYVWRKTTPSVKPGDSYDVPYFINELGEGEYVGIGRRKKQYNSHCYLHDD